jgi:hypothetical protein
VRPARDGKRRRGSDSRDSGAPMVKAKLPSRTDRVSIATCTGWRRPDKRRQPNLLRMLTEAQVPCRSSRRRFLVQGLSPVRKDRSRNPAQNRQCRGLRRLRWWWRQGTRVPRIRKLERPTMLVVICAPPPQGPLNRWPRYPVPRIRPPNPNRALIDDEEGCPSLTGEFRPARPTYRR